MTKEEILLEMKANPLILKTVDKEYMLDKSFMIEVAKIDDVSMAFVPDELLNDKDFVNELLLHDSKKLRFASQSLRDNDEFILSLLKQDVGKEYILKYASLRFRNDKNLVLYLIENEKVSLSVASKELLNDKNFILSAMKIEKSNFRFASIELRCDVELIDYLLEGAAYEEVIDEYYDNKMYWNWMTIYTPEIFLNDVKNREYILELLKSRPEAFVFLSREDLKDKEFIDIAVKSKAISKEIFESLYRYYHNGIMPDTNQN